MKAYIVWNAGRSEGVVFTGEEGRIDAALCASRRFRGVSSALGDAFAELYDDEDLDFQEVELPEPEAGQ